MWLPVLYFFFRVVTSWGKFTANYQQHDSLMNSQINMKQQKSLRRSQFTLRYKYSAFTSIHFRSVLAFYVISVSMLNCFTAFWWYKLRCRSYNLNVFCSAWWRTVFMLCFSCRIDYLTVQVTYSHIHSHSAAYTALFSITHHSLSCPRTPRHADWRRRGSNHRPWLMNDPQ